MPCVENCHPLFCFHCSLTNQTTFYAPVEMGIYALYFVVRQNLREWTFW